MCYEKLFNLLALHGDVYMPNDMLFDKNEFEFGKWEDCQEG